MCFCFTLTSESAVVFLSCIYTHICMPHLRFLYAIEYISPQSTESSEEYMSRPPAIAQRTVHRYPAQQPGSWVAPSLPPQASGTNSTPHLSHTQRAQTHPRIHTTTSIAPQNTKNNHPTTPIKHLPSRSSKISTHLAQRPRNANPPDRTPTIQTIIALEHRRRAAGRSCRARWSYCGRLAGPYRRSRCGHRCRCGSC